MKKLFLLLILLNYNTTNAQTVIDSLVQNGNYLEALEVLQNEPDSFNKFNKSGKIYQQIGNYNKAIQHYQNALGFDTNSVTQRDLAKSFESNGNTKNALEVYKQLVKNDSLNYLDLYKLGKLYAKTKDKNKAIHIFNRLSKIDPSNPNYPYQIGIQTKNKFRKVEAFLNAYKIDTLHSRSIYHIARFFKTINDADSARIFIDKGLEINRNSTKFLKLKIADLYKSKEFKNSLEYGLQLDSLAQNNLFAKQRIGLSYWKLKDFDQAEKYLKQALKVDRQEKSTFYYLGLVYKEMENYKMAKFYFMMAIALDKPDIDNEYYNLGLIAQIERDPPKAIESFKKSFQNNSKNYLALFELAVMSDLYYKDKSIALKHYEKYLERFAHIHKENSMYATKRSKEIKEVLFFEGKE